MTQQFKPSLTLLLGFGAGSLVGGAVAGLCCYVNRRKVCAKKEEDKTSTSSSEARFDFAGVDSYIVRHSLREPKILRELRDATLGKMGSDNMLCDPLQAQFFRLLLNTLDAKKCIDIGAFTGYNTLSMALTLPSDGRVVSCDISDKFINIGKPFFQTAGVIDKINIRIDSALNTLNELIANGESGCYDFVSIDADKSSFDAYYEASLVLLRIGGIVALSNTLVSPQILGGEEKISLIADELERDMALAVHKINEKIKNDNRVQISFLKLAAGVTICRKL